MNGAELNISQEVHARYNQAEYPRVSRWQQFSAALRRFAINVHWPGGITAIPYHKDNQDYFGIFRPAYTYPITPVITEKGYAGEGFLMMQPQMSLPHPSGLPDDMPISGEALAEVMRGGAVQS